MGWKETYTGAPVRVLAVGVQAARHRERTGGSRVYDSPFARSSSCPQTSHLQIGILCCGMRGAPERNWNATSRGAATAGRNSWRHRGHSGTLRSRRRLRRGMVLTPKTRIADVGRLRGDQQCHTPHSAGGRDFPGAGSADRDAGATTETNVQNAIATAMSTSTANSGGVSTVVLGSPFCSCGPPSPAITPVVIRSALHHDL